MHLKSLLQDKTEQRHLLIKYLKKKKNTHKHDHVSPTNFYVNLYQSD